jgi:hypothetical protein
MPSDPRRILASVGALMIFADRRWLCGDYAAAGELDSGS